MASDKNITVEIQTTDHGNRVLECGKMTPQNQKAFYNDCELQPYCNKDCLKCEYFKNVMRREEFKEACDELKDAVIDLFTPILDLISNVIDTIWDTLKVIYQFPNKRVIYLALRHPKEKVRKKNVNRIIKWLRRNGLESKNK